MSCELRKVRSEKLNRLRRTSDVLKISQNRWEEYMELDKIKYYKFKKEEKEDILRRLKEFFEQEERIKLAYIFGGFTRRNGERHRCGCVCVPCIFIQRARKIECECRADAAHICGCHSAPRHRPCVQIEGIKRGHTSENEK